MLMLAMCAHEAQASAQQVLATETIGNVAVRVVSSSLQAVIGLLKKNPVKSIVATVIVLAVSMGCIKCIKQIKLLEKALLREDSTEVQSLLAPLNPKIIQLFINCHMDAFMEDLTNSVFMNDEDVRILKLFFPYCSKEMLNRVNSKGETLLYSFCRNNRLDLVKLLLPHCTRETINRAESVTNRTPLWFAVANNNIEIAKQLLLLCARETINQADIDGQTVLHCACVNNSTEMVRLLLSHCTQDTINRVSSNGKISLYLACRNNNTEMVRLLLPHCTQETINRLNSRLGITALHVACEKNNPQMVEGLVRYGANTLVQNFQGERPLDITNAILADTPLNDVPQATSESRARRRRAERIQQLLTGADRDSAYNNLFRPNDRVLASKPCQRK